MGMVINKILVPVKFLENPQTTPTIFERLPAWPTFSRLHRGGVHCKNTANVTESMKLPAQPAVITTAFEGQIRHRRCTLFLISFKVLHKVYL